MRTGFAVVVAAIVMLVIGVVINVQMEAVQRRLERHGERLPGVVESVSHYAKGPEALVVRYMVDGTSKTAVVYREGLRKNDPVTVLIDRRHPARVGIEGGTQLHGIRDGLSLVLVLLPLVGLAFGGWLIFRAWRWRRFERDRTLTPTFIAGIGGHTTAGYRFPRYTAHLLGRLTVDREALRWTPLMPWRKPKRVEVPWNAIVAMEKDFGGLVVYADGWERLMFGVSRWRQLVPILEDLGFVVHRSPGSPNREQILRPGVKPDSRPAATPRWRTN